MRNEVYLRLKQTESYVIGYQLLHFGGANLAAFAYRHTFYQPRGRSRRRLFTELY